MSLRDRRNAVDKVTKWQEERADLDLAVQYEDEEHARRRAWLMARRRMLTELIEGRAIEAQMPNDLVLPDQKEA